MSRGVAIYTRTAGEDPGVQEARCRQWAESRGWYVQRVYHTSGTSCGRALPRRLWAWISRILGLTPEKEAYGVLIRAVKSGQHTDMVSLRPDRYTRQESEMAKLLKVAVKSGVEIHTVQESLADHRGPAISK